jgi:hypothetical protein
MIYYTWQLNTDPVYVKFVGFAAKSSAVSVLLIGDLKSVVSPNFTCLHATFGYIVPSDQNV